jgi:hypothetical protein
VSASVRTGASMEDTRDAFSGSAAAAAAWLAGRFPSTPLPMDEFVGRKGYDKLVETVNGLRAPPAVISDWMALGDSLLKRVRALDAEAKMLKTLLADLPERPETPITDKRMMFRAAALAMEDWAKGNAVRAKLSVGTSELPAQQEGESWAKTAERLLEGIIVDRETARQRTQRASLAARLASAESESADVSVVGELLEQVIIEKVRATVLPTFEQIVQSAMPTFRLDSGLFVPGRDENGQTYWGLSGSEEIEALICMAAMNPVPGAVNCIIGDDRDFDPYHLSEMMKALDDAPSQVILTATKPPVGRWRGSWKIIDLTPASE